MVLALEKWLAVGSLALFGMFAGEMLSIYNFMTDIPQDLELVQFFEADPKLIQFASIGAAPAGILAAVSFIMSRNYGSRQNGALIIAGGVVLLVGMYVCTVLTGRIDDAYKTDAVVYTPILFMALSPPVILFGAYLMRHKKVRPKKEYF